ncbi:MAG TPA: LysR family transcriptional regulator [Bryobacteraceae bacterium]|nr:LysR family transcriptional regulator [Bryobacteraceae bacterium]HUO30459.1 LysR family transcriptional regulator [Bryobacteraceae bacterium]
MHQLMDFDGLDLNLLVALDALFAEKSVSRAGERLHLSQSATSGALARLREAFHDPLLVQVGRRMSLTPVAEGLVEPVRDFLIRAEAIVNNSPAFGPAASTRKFRLLMSDYAQTVVMTEALPRLQKVAPNVGIEIIPIVGEHASALERGEIDLSFGPATYLVPGHPSERLYEDEFVCLAWSGNRRVERSLSLETYLRLGHIVVRFGKHRELPTFDEWFTRHLGHERRIEVVTTAFNLVPQLLIGTSRIATVHRRLAIFYRRFLPLRIIPPPLEIPKFEQFMQWHRSRDRDPGSVWLRSVLKSAVAASSLNQEVPTVIRAGHGRRVSAKERLRSRPSSETRD